MRGIIRFMTVTSLDGIYHIQSIRPLAVCQHVYFLVAKAEIYNARLGKNLRYYNPTGYFLTGESFIDNN